MATSAQQLLPSDDFTHSGSLEERNANLQEVSQTHAMQDETGASAILAEQLDASMGGRPQEHREVQGDESSAFQSVSAIDYDTWMSRGTHAAVSPAMV